MMADALSPADLLRAARFDETTIAAIAATHGGRLTFADAMEEIARAERLSSGNGSRQAPPGIEETGVDEGPSIRSAEPSSAPREASAREIGFREERKMGTSERHNGCGSQDGGEREREAVERERERVEREREKLERQRLKLERLQQEMEARLQRQEERLEELEEELEEREEALEEAAEGLNVEGVEGIREMLDVVSERLPRIVRDIQERVYAPDRLKETAEAFAFFYRTLVDAGMPVDAAADLTRIHFENLDAQTRVGARPARPADPRTAPDPNPDALGPQFDPLGPHFDPFGPHFRPFDRPRPEPRSPEDPSEPPSP